MLPLRRAGNFIPLFVNAVASSSFQTLLIDGLAGAYGCPCAAKYWSASIVSDAELLDALDVPTTRPNLSAQDVLASSPLLAALAQLPELERKMPDGVDAD